MSNLALKSDWSFEKTFGFSFFLQLEKFARKLPGQYKAQLKTLISQTKEALVQQYKSLSRENEWLKSQNMELVKENDASKWSKAKMPQFNQESRVLAQVSTEEFEMLPFRSHLELKTLNPLLNAQYKLPAFNTPASDNFYRHNLLHADEQFEKSPLKAKLSIDQPFDHSMFKAAIASGSSSVLRFASASTEPWSTESSLQGKQKGEQLSSKLESAAKRTDQIAISVFEQSKAAVGNAKPEVSGNQTEDETIESISSAYRSAVQLKKLESASKVGGFKDKLEGQWHKIAHDLTMYRCFRALSCDKRNTQSDSNSKPWQAKLQKLAAEFEIEVKEAKSGAKNLLESISKDICTITNDADINSNLAAEILKKANSIEDNSSPTDVAKTLKCVTTELISLEEKLMGEVMSDLQDQLEQS